MNSKFIYIVLFVFVAITAKAQYTDSYIQGVGVPGLDGEFAFDALAGSEYVYEIKYPSGLVMPEDYRSMVTWEVEGGSIKSQDYNKPSVTVVWNLGVTEGKIKAVSIYENIGSTIRYVSRSTTVRIKDPQPIVKPSDLIVRSLNTALIYEQFDIEVVYVGSGYTVRNLQCSGENLEIISGQGSSHMRARFKAIGNQSIHVMGGLFDNKGNYVETISGKKYVFVLTDRIEQTGDGYTCDNKITTFSIPALSVNSPITWSCSNGMLKFVSAQGTKSIDAIGISGKNGTEVVSASFSYEGRNFKLRTTTSVGSPVVTDITGPRTLRVGESGIYEAQPSIYEDPNIKYDWRVVPNDAIQNVAGPRNAIRFNQSGEYKIVCAAVHTPCSMDLSERFVLTVNVTANRYRISQAIATRAIEVHKNDENISTYTVNQLINYTLVDLFTGKIADEGRIDSRGGCIDGSNLSKGVYSLILKLDSEQQEVHKLVLK